MLVLNFNNEILMKNFILVSVLACISMPIFAAEQVNQTNVKLDKNCSVNPNIERNPLPHTPNNMSLPEFGQGIIGWATGPEGAQQKLNTVTQTDITNYKKNGVNLKILQEWQAFYENETKRNSCNPTAPIRAKLMKKIITLWN
jgi:hypothetical protein